MSTPQRHSSPKRIAAGERTFFVTACTWGKRSLLQSSRAADLFIHTLFDYRAQGKYQLHDFVVMPDHFHILITVNAAMTIERAVQFVKGGFSFRAGKELGFRAPVWQKGFSEIRVLDLETFENQRRCIRNNPVAAHLAVTAEQYSYSSAHGGWDLDPPPPRLKPVFLAELCARLKARPDTNRFSALAVDMLPRPRYQRA
jgi:putative transposase